MSQHRYNTTLHDGTEVDILCGWDRPLQQYFLVICETGSEYEDDFIYSNLADDNANTSDWKYFENVLVNKGLLIPLNMSKAVFEDGLVDKGNSVTVWDTEAAGT